MEPCRLAVVQAAPVFLDREATVHKAAELVGSAASQGAQMVVLPESFVPGYPLWVWTLRPSDFEHVESLYAELVAHSVGLGGEDLAEIQQVAAEKGVHVIVGVTERNEEASGYSLFNTLVHIDSSGALAGKRRKLVPTGPERMIWSQGDGSTLDLFQTSCILVAGLICWENYMPLARYAMYSQGAELIAAATWDESSVWQSSMRHIAKEGRVYVASSSIAMSLEHIPERYAFRASFGEEGGWFKKGGSMIVDPEGTVIAGPLEKEEGILFADLNPRLLAGVRWNLDVAGHYARPDVFSFSVDRSSRSPMDQLPMRSNPPG